MVEVYGHLFPTPQFGFRYGYLDREGKWAIKPKFREATHFREGLAPVSGKSVKDYYIDKTGKKVLEPSFEFSQLYDFGDGLAAVRVGPKFGYIDKTGNWAIEPKFDRAQPFGEGLAAVSVSGKFGFINKQGQLVIPPKFDLAGNFGGGLAFVEKRFVFGTISRYGLIDKTGQFIVPLRLNNVPHYDNGLWGVGGSYVEIYFDRNGRVVWPATASVTQVKGSTVGAEPAVEAQPTAPGSEAPKKDDSAGK